MFTQLRYATGYHDSMNDPIFCGRKGYWKALFAGPVQEEFVGKFSNPSLSPFCLLRSVSDRSLCPSGPGNMEITAWPRDGFFTKNNDVRAADDKEIAHLFTVALPPLLFIAEGAWI